ncbi:MAG: T9SS type A sorting domain-containing protein [Candidatus Kapabacteria bacterium]|nr:T9SS type A sorting domain-containing protein [Candidatus Kapabacteria bacterium]
MIHDETNPNGSHTFTFVTYQYEVRRWGGLFNYKNPPDDKIAFHYSVFAVDRTTSADEENTIINDFQVFPTIANNNISVKLLNLTQNVHKISVFNSIGDLLIENSFSNTSKTIDISHLSNGVYFVLLDGKRSNTQKFVINR